MNRLLADTLSFLNGLIAVVIIVAGGGIGYFSVTFAGQRPLGLLIGALIGLVVAAFVCGAIAYLALIEAHLRKIAAGSAYHAENPDQSLRREPTL